ncbi:MAG: PilZ domain-containing protein [Candidatus Binatia bacterium]
MEKQLGKNLSLRILAEVGKVSLIRLKKGSLGQLEIDNQVFPFEVSEVNLPIITVATNPEQSRPVRRQLLRLPASFSVRFRRQGTNGLWISGRGVDISAGGCCFTITPPHLPKQGEHYTIELKISLPTDGEEELTLDAEVRWVKLDNGVVAVGVEVHDPAQRRDLAEIVTTLQQSLARHPEDYLLK